MTSRQPTSMTRKTLKTAWRFALLAIWAGIVLPGIGRASDDSDLKLSTTDGTTQFGIQNSNAVDLITMNSLGAVSISSNTILPGTTFYQAGNAIIGFTTSQLGFFGHAPAGQQASTTPLQTFLTNLGFYSGTGSVPFNTGTGALTVGNAITSLGNTNFTISGAGLVTKNNAVATIAGSMGVPTMVVNISSTAQSATIAAQNLNFTAVPPANAILQLNYYLVVTTAGGSGSTSVTITWTDVSGSASQGTFTSNTITNNTLGSNTSGTLTIQTNGSAIKYATTYSGTGTYALYITGMRLI